MAYLADRFGADIHRRLLRSVKPTFARALTDETKTDDASALFEDFRKWLNAL